MSIAFGAALLGACASQQAAAPPPPAPVEAPAAEATPAPAEPAFTATPNLAPRERFHKAVKDLETGDADQAKAELRQYLAEVTSNNKRAEALLSQIESPVEEYFPPESFPVVVGTGETLSTLAQTFLGDALKFYILSRYNGIANPSQVSAGQTIRIPRTAGALAAREAHDKRLADKLAEPPAANAKPPSARPVPKISMAAIRKMAAAGDTGGAIREIEAHRLDTGQSVADATFVADTYLASARALRASNPALAARRAQKAGEQYLRMGDKPDKALEAAQLAAALDPDNAGTKKLLASARTATAERYYRSGLSSFRRQELDAAIAAWDKALEIDPSHGNAKAQRAQAIDLKQKLSTLR